MAARALAPRVGRAALPPCRSQQQRWLFLVCCQADLVCAKQLCGNQSRAGMQISGSPRRRVGSWRENKMAAEVLQWPASDIHWKKTHPFMWETGNSLPALHISPPGFSWMSIYGRAGFLAPWRRAPSSLCAAPVRGRSGAGKAAGALPLLRNGVFPRGNIDNHSNSHLTNCWFSSILNLLFCYWENAIFARKTS